MELVLTIAVLAAVVWLVAAPLRRGQAGETASRASSLRADLEQAKSSKYAEIRELELDWRTGKLSDADFRAQDRALRAEAVEILRRLDEMEPDPEDPAPSPAASDAG